MGGHLTPLGGRSEFGLVVAAMCTAIAFFIQWLLAAYAGPTTPPFLAFFPAIVVSTLVGGAAVGWVTLAASVALAGHFLVTRADGVPEFNLPRLLILTLFLFSGAVIVLIVSAYRRSLDDIERDREALRSSETRLRLAHEAAKIGTWEYVIAEDHLTWSPEMFLLFDLDPSGPTPTLAEWRARIQLEGNPQALYNLRRDLRLSGETLDRDLRVLTFKGRTRWLLGRSVAVGEEGKPPTRFIGASIDITDQKTSQERERLLAHELDHRAKNMLAMVQSVVRLTRTEHLPDFREAVIGRIQSLARSHSLLAASRWQGADMMELIRDELEPFMSGEHAEIKASGPRIRLQPAAAQTLALLIHELATNAVKYGALSTEVGRLTVYWRLSRGTQGGDLCLTWTEMGGPQVRIPMERGFGSRLIVTSVERQLKGTVTMNWLATGLHCEVTVPAEHLAPVPEDDSDESQITASETSANAVEKGGGRRILLVEDETLIAMQTERSLSEAGYTVIGPIARLGDAPEAIANHALDGAILDINLNGERSFAIADLLVSRRVPFMFCTGFAAASILPDRFRFIPVIVKPFSAATLLMRLQETLSNGPMDFKRIAAMALESE